MRVAGGGGTLRSVYSCTIGLVEAGEAKRWRSTGDFVRRFVASCGDAAGGNGLESGIHQN